MVLEAVHSYGQALKFVDEQLHLGPFRPGFNMFQHLVDPHIPLPSWDIETLKPKWGSAKMGGSTMKHRDLVMLYLTNTIYVYIYIYIYVYG